MWCLGVHVHCSLLRVFSGHEVRDQRSQVTRYTWEKFLNVNVNADRVIFFDCVESNLSSLSYVFPYRCIQKSKGKRSSGKDLEISQLISANFLMINLALHCQIKKKYQVGWIVIDGRFFMLSRPTWRLHVHVDMTVLECSFHFNLTLSAIFDVFTHKINVRVALTVLSSVTISLWWLTFVQGACYCFWGHFFISIMHMYLL